MALECAAGWGEAITLLKFYLEHGLIYTTPQRSKTDRFDSPFQVYTLVVSMHVPAYLKKR